MSYYRPWGSTENGRIEFESLSDDTLEGALNVIRKSFFLYENVCRAVELNSEPGASKELEELCLYAAKDGVSVVAIDITTNEVVGVAFNKIQMPSNSSEKSFFECFSENCRYKSSKALVDFMIDVDSRTNLFKHYRVNCILEIMFLATLPNYGKRQIGEMLVASSLELGKELRRDKNVRIPITIQGSNKVTNADAVPTLASAIMTSKYSYQIAMKLYFNQLLEISYDECEYNGKKYSERINSQEHRRCVLVAKRLSSM
ncbi:PREDICTED: uncharacterized protein LOC108770935 isoform X2 [Trachymyrmex cornetzi]|uniref:N-acetyltransferase domain-containing protein n=2 Tax=Trachymyrmex cornetzi TaxID=471704 RepID=A0A195EHS0_9HYME|nr:PREDICTED: uncharacterized protein LOC108770935 isoform X2 [Trachymyrmex cornetzi]KYN27800.1 hypothetical protein ALC57_02864 [Trachymyrmex cornetzi]